MITADKANEIISEFSWIDDREPKVVQHIKFGENFGSYILRDPPNFPHGNFAFVEADLSSEENFRAQCEKWQKNQRSNIPDTKTAQDAWDRVNLARFRSFSNNPSIEYLEALSLRTKNWLEEINIELTKAYSKRNNF